MSAWRTNRSGKHFKGSSYNPSKPVGLFRFEYRGNRDVDGGNASGYWVFLSDGSKIPVEFLDKATPEAVDSKKYYGEDEEESVAVKDMYKVTVLWNDEVDFETTYDANNPLARLSLERSLVKRYGKMAEDFLGKSKDTMAEDVSKMREEHSEEGFM